MMSPAQYPLVVNRLGGATLTEGLYSSQNLGRTWCCRLWLTVGPPVFWKHGHMEVLRWGVHGCGAYGNQNVEIPFLRQDSLRTPSLSPGGVCDRASKSRASTSNHMVPRKRLPGDSLWKVSRVQSSATCCIPFHERVMAVGGILELIQVPIMPCMSCLSSWHLGRKCWDEIISQEMVRRSMVIWLFLFVRGCSFLLFPR